MTAHAHKRGEDCRTLLLCCWKRFSQRWHTMKIADTKTNLSSPILAVCLRGSAVAAGIAPPTKTVFNQLSQGAVVRPVWPQLKIITVPIRWPDSCTLHLHSDVHWWKAASQFVGISAVGKMFCSEFVARPQAATEIFLQYGPVLRHFAHIRSPGCARDTLPPPLKLSHVNHSKSNNTWWV